MEVTGKRTVEIVTNIICDGCGGSCAKGADKDALEYATLAARWGYYSQHDGEIYSYHLCEYCFFGVLAYLKERARGLELAQDRQNRLAQPTGWYIPGSE